MVTKPYILYRILYTALLFCLLPAAGLAQGISFTASVDKDKVNLNGQVELTLTVSGSQDPGAPELPPLDGFEIISQGSASQFSFINGEMAVSKSFTYTLTPTRKGTLTIDPAAIKIAGRIYKTDPLTVEVLPAGALPHSSAKKTAVTVPVAPGEPEDLTENIFVEVTTDKKEAYLGEQIVMTFKLYRRGVMIDNLQYTPPETKGFVAESMGPQKEYKDTVNGIVYSVIELNTAVFPVSSGMLTIEPAKLKCDLLVRKYRKRSRRQYDFFDDFFDDSFFAPYTRYPLELKSDPVTITVKPLPAEGKPKSFKGAVGAYDLICEADPRTLKAGEPINIVMKISGAGNISTVPEPVIDNPEGFKTYESEIKTKITGRTNIIAGEKTFQKILIPLNEKIKEIPPIKFSYFDPLKETYRTITKGPLPISVLPAPQKDSEIVELIKQSIPEDEAKKAVKLLARDIQYIKTGPGRLSKTGALWYRNVWLWIILFILPVILFISSLFYQSHRIRLKEDSAYAKIRNAYKTAVSTLKTAAASKKKNNFKEFYDTLARAVQRYISDKLNLPKGTVSINSLVSKNIPADIIKRIKSLLNTCDLARFGAASFSVQDMDRALKEASYLIKILEKKL